MKKAILFGLLVLFVGEVSVFGATPKGDCGCDAGSNPPSLDGKLINAQEIMKGFEQGKEKVKVIVNLAEPPEIKAEVNWKSKQSLQELHDRIKIIQLPVLAALSKNEFKLKHRFENQAGFSGEVTLQALEKLIEHPLVASIEPVYVLQPHLTQGIALMNGDTYRTTYNGRDIAIAICDTGIDYTHPRLGGGGFPNTKVIGGYDFGDTDSNPFPHNSRAHGTCCAGIAAGNPGAAGDYNGGVAYNAKLYALKITAGSASTASSDAMVAAWDWCVSHQNDDPAHPIMVISTSFGGNRHFSSCDSTNSSMTNAANNAVAAGITVLASSGNDGYCNSMCWPACISNVISVGAVYDAHFGSYWPCVSEFSCATKYAGGGCSTGYYAIDDTVADMVTSYSNTASFLDILAPSNQAYTTDIVGSGGYSSGDYYSSFGGTSAACPYAAGAVASLQEAAMDSTGDYLTPGQVRSTLINAGDNITDGKVAITKPRINLAAAIDSLSGENNDPILYNAQVVPEVGCTGQEFEYLVAYNDPDGDHPSQIEVSIDGTPYPMTLKSGTAASGTYHRLKVLGPGTGHNFWIYAFDGRGGFDDTPLYDGPDVGECTGDDLSKQGDQWDDSAGDGDHIPEAGETIGMRVRLESDADVTDVEATLTSSNGNINITEDQVYYGDISAGQRKWPGADFNMELNFSSTTVCEFVIHLSYYKDSILYNQDIPFSRTIYADGAITPFFEIASVTTYETSHGDGDGIPESGEFVDFDIDLRNIGTANAYDIRARVTNVNVGHVREQWQEYFDISQGNTGRGHHPFGFGGGGGGIPANFAGWISIDLEIESAGGNVQHLIDEAIFEAQPAAWINVDPREWDFGVSNTSTDVLKTFTISNSGSENLTVSNISTSHPADTTTSWDSNPIIIPPGGSENIDVTIETSSLSGLIERQVTVISDVPPAHTNGDRVIITGLVSDVPPAHQVPTTSTAAEKVDCSGNIIVWADTRNGWDIYAYDLSTQTEIPICTDSNVQDTPRIDGDIIAWEDCRNSVGWENPDIYAYNLATDQNIVVSNNSAYEQLVGVGDGIIAFSRVYNVWGPHPRDGASDLYIYDVGTETTTNITNFTPGGSMESVDSSYWDFGGDTLTWQQGTVTPPSTWSNPKIMKIKIGVDSSPVQIGSIWTIGIKTNDGKVTWTDDDSNGYRQIWLWDGSSSQVTTESTDHARDNFAIGTDIIVYNKSGLNPRLFAWDLATSTESQVVESAMNNSARMDGHLLAWSYGGNVYYTFLKEADIAVSSPDIVFSDEQPYEGDIIDVNVTVHNLNPWDTTEDITVRLYDGDPNDPNTQLGSDEVISSGIVAQGSAIVEFNDVPVGVEGIHNIYACINVPGGDNPANNKACKTLTVGDTDIQGPIISNVVVQEFNGNGDGRIEDDEQVLISWQATDVSGINSSWCTIDANDYAASGTYYVIVGPYQVGNYDFIIFATDGDISPETSQYSEEFTVSIAGDINEDGKVNFKDVKILANQWLEVPGTLSADLAPSPLDNFVNFLDFAVLAGNWLAGVE